MARALAIGLVLAIGLLVVATLRVHVRAEPSADSVNFVAARRGEAPCGLAHGLRLAAERDRLAAAAVEAASNGDDDLALHLRADADVVRRGATLCFHDEYKHLERDD
jgi:hypothetical protein